jgi:hypothetical protein
MEKKTYTTPEIEVIELDETPSILQMSNTNPTQDGVGGN